MSGSVTPALLEAVQRELSAEGEPVDTLAINSRGGDLASAIQLGTIVRERGMTVRVDGLCAGPCAMLLAPAAKRLVVPEGSFLVATPIPSPRGHSAAVEAYRDAPSSAAAIQLEAMRWGVEYQDAYFAKLDLDPARIYTIVQAIVDMNAALAAAGETDTPGLILDKAYLQTCLAIPSVSVPEFDASDSEEFARISGRPVGFLVDGTIFYEGAEVIEFRPEC